MPWSRTIRLAVASAGISSSRRSGGGTGSAARRSARSDVTHAVHRRKRDGEPCPLTDPARDVDAAAVRLGQLARDGEAKAGTGLGTLGSLKELVEDEGQIRLGDPAPAILDRDGDGALAGAGRDGDVRAGRCVLDPVPDQVREHLADPVLVARDGRVAGRPLDDDAPIAVTRDGP